MTKFTVGNMDALQQAREASQRVSQAKRTLKTKLHAEVISLADLLQLGYENKYRPIAKMKWVDLLKWERFLGATRIQQLIEQAQVSPEKSISRLSREEYEDLRAVLIAHRNRRLHQRELNVARQAYLDGLAAQNARRREERISQYA